MLKCQLRNMNQTEKNKFNNEKVDEEVVIDTVYPASCDNNFNDNLAENVNETFQELVNSLTDSETKLDELLCDKNNDEDFGFEAFKFNIFPSEATTSFNKNKLCYESVCVKDDFEKQIIFLRGTLEMILGDKFEMYEKVMQDWFADKIEYEDYDKLIRQYLSEDAVLIHNRFIMAILNKSYQPFDNSLLSNFDHFTFDKVLEESHEALKSKSELSDNQSESSLAVFNEENEEDEEMVMIKKRRNKRKSRFKILDDEEDDIEEMGTKSTADDEHIKNRNLFRTKKKRRTMLITSDDEDGEAESNSILDAESSNSNNVVYDANTNDPNSINIKSSGLLKTTLTIKRNFQDVTAPSQSSLLDQLLSSNAPISLLPQTNSELNNSHQTHSKMALNIQNSSSNQDLNSKIGLNNKTVLLKSQLLKQCLTNVPSVQINSNKISSKKLNASLLSNTISTDLLPTINSVSPSSHAHDSNSKLLENNQGTSLLDRNQFETTNSSSNSKIVELLNRKSPSTMINDTSNNKNKLLFSSTSASQNCASFSIESLFDSNSNDDQQGSNLLDNNATKPKKAKSAINNKEKKRTAKKKILSKLNTNAVNNDTVNVVTGFVGNDFDSRSVQSFAKYDPIIDGHHNNDSLNNYLTNKDKIKIENCDQPVCSDVVQVRPMSPQERISKLKSCFQDVSLPDSIRLGLRISEYASQNGLSFVDKRVSYVCNIALKNFIKNILTELSTFRSSFVLRHNRIQHHIGNPTINPYLPNSYKAMQKESYLFYDNPPRIPYPLSYNSIDDAGAMVLLDLRPRVFGLERNQLHFNWDDSSKFDSNKAKFRTTSGSFFAIDNKVVHPSGCTLRHLYNILNTNRSLIPVHSVWSKALYRTIAAFNNVEDYNIIDK